MLEVEARGVVVVLLMTAVPHHTLPRNVLFAVRKTYRSVRAAMAMIVTRPCLSVQVLTLHRHRHRRAQIQAGTTELRVSFPFSLDIVHRCTVRYRCCTAYSIAILLLS